ncbi:hypothetical protein DMENIID0001_114100 [Sergentomyia squamirostris]
MLFKSYLQWYLAVQKFIVLPNYQLPKGKFRRIVLLLRILFLISFNIISVYDFWIIWSMNTDYVDSGSGVGNALGILESTLERVGIFVIDLLTLLHNKSHLELIEKTVEFENELIKCVGENKIRRYGRKSSKAYINMFLIVIWGVFCNLAFLSFRLNQEFNTTFITWYFHIMIIESVQHSVIFYILTFIDLIAKYSEFLDNALKNPTGKHRTIPHTVEVFNILTDYLSIIDLISSTFGTTIVYIFIHHFFEAWCSLYFSVWMIFWHQWNQSSLIHLICFIIWTTRSITIVIVTALVCQKCSQKTQIATHSLGRVYQDYCGCSDMNFHERCIQFNAQQYLLSHLHREVKISASELFTIDFQLVSAIFSSIATYLVILLQFKQLEGYLEEN